MFWIIENFTKEDSYIELAKAVQKLGFDHLLINGDYKHSMVDDIIKTNIFDLQND